MPANKKIFASFRLSHALVLWLVLNSNCHVSYGLHDVSIPPDVKTVKVNFIENRARYINPVLSPALTDKLRQKIVGQTRLTQTNADNADWEVSGYVNDYSVSTSGISQQQPSINRLNVAVHISLLKRKSNDQQEFDVTHSFDFSGNLTLQAAEAQLSDAIIRDMTDEIFNHIFSNW
jgi:lipopolysaccharide assembly LptE-like protein